MVEPGWLSAKETTQVLGITLNNLRQLQHRKVLRWKKKEGRNVYYFEPDVLAVFEKRQSKKV